MISILSDRKQKWMTKKINIYLFFTFGQYFFFVLFFHLPQSFLVCSRILMQWMKTNPMLWLCPERISATANLFCIEQKLPRKKKQIRLVSGVSGHPQKIVFSDRQNNVLVHLFGLLGLSSINRNGWYIHVKISAENTSALCLPVCSSWTYSCTSIVLISVCGMAFSESQ